MTHGGLESTLTHARACVREHACLGVKGLGAGSQLCNLSLSDLQPSHLENGKKCVQENGCWTEGRVGSAPCLASEAWPSPDLELSNLSSVLSGGEG